MGDTTRYALETASGATVTVKQQNRAGNGLFAPSQPACVTWSIGDTRLVADFGRTYAACKWPSRAKAAISSVVCVKAAPGDRSI